MKIIHELINLGKGIYGDGYTQITTDDLLKIYDQREAATSGGGSTTGITTTNGHVILDGNGSIMTQQPNLRFNRMIVTNDNVNSQTIVTRPPSIILSTTPPLNPLQGDEWINSNTWKTYVYYDSYWVEQSRTGLGDQLFKPVLNSYISQSVMIADQGSQLSGYLYYDGTSYWEYLGTTTGTISDYRAFGGVVDIGFGLSYDILGKIQLGEKTNDGERVINIDDFEVGEFGNRSFKIENTDATLSLGLFDDPAEKGFYFYSFLPNGDDYVDLTIGGGNVSILRAILDNSVQKTQEISFKNRSNLSTMVVRDEINLKGFENEGDYEPNFTARSLVTKQYVDVALSGSTTILAGIGLSKSISTISLGDNTTLFYTDTPTVKDFFLYQIGTSNLTSLYSGFGVTSPTLGEAGFAATNAAGSRGAEIKVEYNSASPNPLARIQINNGSGLFNIISSDETTGYRVRDDIKTIGLVYHANYFTNGSLNDRWIPDWGAVKGYADTAGSGINKVSYNIADSKNATERNQARVNIGSTSATPQIIATAGAINDLAVTSNSLVFTGTSVVLSGIVAGLDGEEIAILNASGTNLELLSQSILSSANNRFASGVVVPNLSIVRLKYRTTTARWVLENVGINDGRYLRKDVADTKTGNLTMITGNLQIQAGSTGRLDWVTASTSSNGDGSIRLGENGVEAFRIGRDNVTVRGFSVPQFSRPVYFYDLVEWRTGGLFGTNTAQMNTATGRMWHARSGNFNESVRRDELYLNFSETVATTGTVDNLSINNQTKLLILTGANDLTGIVPVDNTRLLRIEARGGARIIRDQSTSSTDVNRFAIGADLTINDGEVYQFIYTNSRWRRVL
jgi:hypothetical protein